MLQAIVKVLFFYILGFSVAVGWTRQASSTLNDGVNLNATILSSATKLKGSLIVWLILVLMLLEDVGVKCQDDAIPDDDTDTEPAPVVDTADGASADEAAPVAPDSAATPNTSPDPINKNTPSKVYNESLLLDRFQSKPIFETDKCAKELYCNGANGSRVHTLCRTLETPRCDRYREFTIFKVDGIKLIELEEMIVNGHNGLRNRIAEKMHVGNMVELVRPIFRVYQEYSTWDDQLAQMTLAYYLQCAEDVDDPCTEFTMPANLIPQPTDYYEYETFKWVAQNRFNMKAEFFPTNFIEVALRSWYFEKDKLVRPTLETDEYLGITYGKLLGENNFMHLAYPLTFRIGCSLAQIDNSFSLICNYYPFYRFNSKDEFTEMIFVSDEPATYCPTYFPLKHEYFPNLCTDQYSKAAKQFEMLSFGVASLIVIIWFIWY